MFVHENVCQVQPARFALMTAIRTGEKVAINKYTKSQHAHFLQQLPGLPAVAPLSFALPGLSFQQFCSSSTAARRVAVAVTVCDLSAAEGLIFWQLPSQTNDRCKLLLTIYALGSSSSSSLLAAASMIQLFNDSCRVSSPPAVGFFFIVVAFFLLIEAVGYIYRCSIPS
jgi:hypothetical protein